MIGAVVQTNTKNATAISVDKRKMETMIFVRDDGQVAHVVVYLIFMSSKDLNWPHNSTFFQFPCVCVCISMLYTQSKLRELSEEIIMLWEIEWIIDAP